MTNLFISFLLSIAIAPIFIHLTKKLQFRQSVREDGPATHLSKTGTPTLGGVIFLTSIFVTTLAYIEFTDQIKLLLFITIALGFIGFSDDFIKIYFKRNLGLTSKQKLVGQFAVAGVFLYFLNQTSIDTTVYIPFVKEAVEFSWFYFVFVTFMIVGTTNATNLTDGLDGLLTGTSIFAFTAFAAIAALQENWSIFFFILTMIGSLSGFLLFNWKPAKIFMGDTGSLAIGGTLVGLSIILKVEFALLVIGAVFVIEASSVIIQVISFKLRKKRIFKMSPIHHHFELNGHEESKVVKGFYVAGSIFAVLGIIVPFV
jgi:phospho-N-acetylmuramoyl-pentapeptide-transferase